VGAGPRGLATSNLLSRYGCGTCWWRSTSAPRTPPARHIVNQSTVEISGTGDRGEAARGGHTERADGNNVWHTSLAGRELARIWAWGTGPDGRRNYARPAEPDGNAPQTRLEPVLLDAARSTARRPPVRHELVSYTQDVDGVTALVRERATGDTYRLRCAYLVGADGARSQVVQQAGLPIEASRARRRGERVVRGRPDAVPGLPARRAVLARRARYAF